jgi:hypothetical protein
VVAAVAAAVAAVAQHFHDAHSIGSIHENCIDQLLILRRLGIFACWVVINDVMAFNLKQLDLLQKPGVFRGVVLSTILARVSSIG